MMIELLTLTYHSIGRLHVQAADAKTPEEAKVFNAAAARLNGEFRRTALALKTYRMPVVQKSFTVVKQANVTTGNQQVAYVDQEGKATVSTQEAPEPIKALRLSHEQYEEIIPRTIQRDSAQEEAIDVRSAKPRSARKAKAIDLPDEAVGAVYGAEDLRRKGQGRC
jgi:hypothetical protein